MEIEEQEYKRLKSREEKLMAYYKWYVDKEHNLTEVEDIITENIKLKSDLSLVIKERDDNIKQNKKLKSDLAFKETMLDNVSAEYESLQDVIKKLKAERDMHRDAAKDCGYDIKELQERIRFLEQCLDNKEKVNKSLREENKRLSDFLECES